MTSAPTSNDGCARRAREMGPRGERRANHRLAARGKRRAAGPMKSMFALRSSYWVEPGGRVAFVQYASAALAYAPYMIKTFDLSAGMFVRGLTNLKGMLAKGETHASAGGVDPAALLGARLAGDMFNLAAQAHWASEGAKLALQRLLGVTSTPSADEAKSFAELYNESTGQSPISRRSIQTRSKRGSSERLNSPFVVVRGCFGAITFSSSLRSRISFSTSPRRTGSCATKECRFRRAIFWVDNRSVSGLPSRRLP